MGKGVAVGAAGAGVGSGAVLKAGCNLVFGNNGGNRTDLRVYRVPLAALLP